MQQNEWKKFNEMLAAEQNFWTKNSRRLFV